MSSTPPCGAASRAHGSGSARSRRGRRRRSAWRFAGASWSARDPVGGDFARRFVASAAESGIDVFRLEDPLNDVSNLREAGEAITAADREFDAGLIYSPGRGGETKPLVEQAKKLPDLGAARVLLHDPSGALEPHRAHELVAALAEGSGLPVGLYCQGAAGSGLACCVGGGTRRRRSGRVRRVSDRADAAPGLGRSRGQCARGRRDGQRRQRRDALGGGRDRRRVHRRRPGHPARPAHRDAGSAARAPGGARRRHRYAPSRPRSSRPPRRRPRGAGRDSRRSGIAAGRSADRADSRLAGDRPRPVREPLPDRRRRAARASRRTLRDAAGHDRPDGADGRSRSCPRASTRTSPRSTSTRSGKKRRAWPRARKSSCCSRSSGRKPSPCCARSATARAARTRCSAEASTRRGPSEFERSCASSRRPGSRRSPSRRRAPASPSGAPRSGSRSSLRNRC